MNIKGLLQRVFGVAQGRRVEPPPPPGVTVKVPPIDDRFEVEGATEALARPAGIAGLALMIDYVDAKGQESCRRIVCRRFNQDTGCLLATCLERGAPRNFRLDRIESVASMETGEIIPLADFLAMLGAGGLPVGDERLRHLLIVLTFVAACDGYFDPRELAALEVVIGSFVDVIDGRVGLREQGFKFAKNIAPQDQDFMASVEWLAMHPDAAGLIPFLCEGINAVIRADGQLAAQERSVADEICRSLSQIAGRSAAQ